MSGNEPGVLEMMLGQMEPNVTLTELRADVDRILAEEHISFDEFCRRGRADVPGCRLEGDRLRDLWLIAGDLLTKPENDE